MKLGAVCQQDRQIVEARSSSAAYLPYLSLENIQSDSGQILRTLSAPDKEEGISTTFKFDRRHILYGKLRPYLNKVALPDYEGRCTTEIIPLLPAVDIDREFLCWLLRRSETKDEAMREKTGSRMPRADMNSLMNLKIPLPSLPEQKRIAAILNERMEAIDKARAAAEAALNEAKTLQYSYVQETLKNRVKYPISLKECLIEVTKGIGEDWHKFPVLGATRDGLSSAKEPPGKRPERYKYVSEGTIFYNPMRILIGSIAFVDGKEEEGITSPDYVVFKTKQGIMHHRWFYHWLRSPQGDNLIRTLARGAVRERMLFKRLSSGYINIPDWNAQSCAAEKIKLVKPLIQYFQSQLREINALPAALLRKAFNGELEA
ncbi:MAG TPA: restriction endonuclease subunit S [Candidatus Aminicenantes bacterium]|nr:restriction endonuclease subunit S [Candidatus Aminicenantes bacterium]HQH46077.1 restriction endonuclease subunit S [Candidatus Aminicenantes bacterium]